jgi:hypothetical protein
MPWNIGNKAGKWTTYVNTAEERAKNTENEASLRVKNIANAAKYGEDEKKPR